MENSKLKGVYIDTEEGTAKIIEIENKEGAINKLLKGETTSKHIKVQGLETPLVLIQRLWLINPEYPKPSSILEDDTKGGFYTNVSLEDVFILKLSGDKLLSLEEKEIQKIMERMTIYNGQICLSVKEILEEKES